ncbi:PhnD/SsuA/transferrin family substrate-binding protein [Oceanisphaera sediminis]|uniref:PhnD/SsuA/transferrin family substrate-binding protein n=1 Tax=Oceanisphaera sediminis TaxID=981381 RepID=A0ABP7DHS5_9GAMM
MRLIASLPWYDLPALRPRLDAFWSVLSHELNNERQPVHTDPVPLPGRLNRHTPLIEQWSHPGLLLSQCCGPDLFTPQARELVPIARPVFGDLDCTPGQYFSYIVSASHKPFRRHDLHRPSRFVINSASSRSGCAALFEWTTANGIDCDQVMISGSHASSLEYLRNGRADVAAIDAHSWPLLDSRGITIIDNSTEAPTPPFVMHRRSPVTPELMQAALSSAIQQAGNGINIEAVLGASRQTYRPIPSSWHIHLPVGASPCCALT